MLAGVALGLAFLIQERPANDRQAEFAHYCVATRADTASVEALVTANGGWTFVDSTSAGKMWERSEGDQVITLTTDRVDVRGPKDACSLEWTNSVPEDLAGLPSGLSPATGAVDAAQGMYVVAPSFEAAEARDFDFVFASHEAGTTMLILAHPVRP